ncbi:MAG TPA: phosphatidylserine/phosphatidylglycerophosphate/cardiolipin synthase family protein, partial [Gaiellaceae bacterium]|nr:phosphatidylserine/phosphatidylglycerophosphate/cardiolipin synthase family protein [Gaiellaceae bacterium]
MSVPPISPPSGRGAVSVREAELPAHAERLLVAPRVELHELALAFEESTATAAEVLVGGTAFFPRMLADVRAAASSVHIVQFGFRPGSVGDRFAEALLEKAREGVAARLVVDRNGSDPERGSRPFYDRLVAGGVQVCMASGTQARGPFGPLGADGRPIHWNLRALGHIDHRKAFVVDGRIGWVGGAGIEDHFEDGRFHDLFVRVEGPVVSQLQLVVLASLRRLGGAVPVEEVPALFPAHDPAPEAVPAIVLHNAPGRFRPITEAIAASLESARETLDVVNPYVTDRGMIRRIEAAARRGARVRLFVPATPNNWACGLAERFHHAGLLRAGVQIHEYPAMLHAKAFVRDGEEVLAGTCNLAAWSLKRFFELDVRVRSRALAEQFEERFAAPAVEVSAP